MPEQSAETEETGTNASSLRNRFFSRSSSAALTGWVYHRGTWDVGVVEVAAIDVSCVVRDIITSKLISAIPDARYGA